MSTKVVDFTDKGYCHATEAHAITVDGRKYSAGWAKDSIAEFGGPIVEGWHGFMNMAATVLSAHREAPRPTVVLSIGDVLEGPEGTLWTITVNPRATVRNCDYLTLVKVEV